MTSWTDEMQMIFPAAREISGRRDRKSTRLNSSHGYISYAVFCLKKKKNRLTHIQILEVSTVYDTTTSRVPVVKSFVFWRQETNMVYVFTPAGSALRKHLVSMAID